MLLAAAIVLVGCSAPAQTPRASTTSAEPVVGARPSRQSSVASASTPPSARPSAAAVELAWEPIATPGPAGREDHTWTVDPERGVAYLFGGRDGSAVFSDLWSYDLSSDTWSEVPAPAGPAARFGHEAVWHDHVGLVVWAGQAGTTFFHDLWAFDPDASAWTELESRGDVPVARYGSCAAIGPDGRLWISHGFTADQERFSDTVAYDFASGEWTDETPADGVPVRRCLHGCWWTGAGELALFGGQTTGVVALGDMWLLDDGTWREVDTAVPAARNLYARAQVPGATLVFGGQATDETYLSDLHVFSDTGGASMPLGPAGQAPPPRAGAEMVFDHERGRALLFGGRDADGAYADVWQLSGAVPAR